MFKTFCILLHRSHSFNPGPRLPPPLSLSSYSPSSILRITPDGLLNCLGDVLPGPGLPIRPVAPGLSGTGPSSDKKSANSAQNQANSSTEILETIAGLPSLSTSTDTVSATDSSDVSDTKNGFENGPGISPDSSQQTFGSETTSVPPTTSFSGLGRLDPIESEEQTNTTERQTNITVYLMKIIKVPQA